MQREAPAAVAAAAAEAPAAAPAAHPIAPAAGQAAAAAPAGVLHQLNRRKRALGGLTRVLGSKRFGGAADGDGQEQVHPAPAAPAALLLSTSGRLQRTATAIRTQQVGGQGRVGQVCYCVRS